jgi:alkylation response protein AidB-like acyl-CoA dehydrogenase
MDNYRAPVEDMQFLIDEVLDAENRLGSLPCYAEAGVGPDLTTALLDEAAKLANDVVAPLRRTGDLHPAQCENGKVICSPGHEDALVQLGQGGWTGIAAPVEMGGQGLPELYGTAASEMWNGANMAFALAPFLSSGAALAIAAHGSDELKRIYAEKINSGEWSGTMNLTESGAGSDLGTLKTRAVPEDGHYRIFGQKIYITWGDHEATDNIIHLVLARLPDAPEGSKGISLFLVPKFLVNPDGSLGSRNDVYPVSVEHKLGIHASPTCVMAYGDNEGAIGYLVGNENEGLRCMFTMMNEARLKVGIQGLGAAEGAFQKARAYAHERVQGGVSIINHADVKRMLLTMRSGCEAMRALAFSEAVTMDLAHAGPEAERPAMQARIDLMIPVIKAWLTAFGEELTSIGVQVHGGMGYVEETGAAQYFRDVRITSIYEGTNGIQAADLVNRKLGRDGGATMESVQGEIADTIASLRESDSATLRAMGDQLKTALAAQVRATQWILEQLPAFRDAALGASYEYLMMTGYLFGGWQLARGAKVAERKIKAGSDRPFYAQKVATAGFYCEQILPRCLAGEQAVLSSAGAIVGYPVDWI